MLALLPRQRLAEEFVLKPSTLAVALTVAFIAPAFAGDTFHLELSFEQLSKSVPHADDTTWTGAHLRGRAIITASTNPSLFEAGTFEVQGVGLAEQRPDAFNVKAFMTLTSSVDDLLHLVASRDTGDIRPGGGGAGTMELQGDTGRFQGIAGACNYDVTYEAGQRAAARAACTWHVVD